MSAFETAGRAASGRVLNVRLSGSRSQTVSASQFRSVVTTAFGARTLRSTHFSFEKSGNRYVFSGRGFGHGVGMSQYGARGQAREGRSYQEILSFYFAGTNLDLRDSALLSQPNYGANTPRRTRPTPRAEPHAERMSPRAEPSRVEQLSPPSSAPIWNEDPETPTRTRRTAW